MMVNTGAVPGITADDVLYAFLEAVPEPGIDDLLEWIRRYPQYRKELMNFAAGNILMKRLPDPQTAPIYDSMLATRGRAVVRDLLERDREEDAAKDSLPISLIAVGAQRGQTIGQLAAATGLSIPLFRLLDRRLVHRIPREVVESIAAALDLSVAALMNYFRQPATLVSTALHRSTKTPSLAKSQDFFDAVRQDRSLDAGQRERLLALEEPGQTIDNAMYE